MARPKNNNHKKSNNGANVGYEAELWQMADALRGSMDAAEYKHVVLGLIFLKYIFDAFEEQHATLRDALLPKLLSGELRISQEKYSARMATTALRQRWAIPKDLSPSAISNWRLIDLC